MIVESATVHGQLSYLLSSELVELAISQTGAMLGPVTFFPDSPQPVRPYAVAPWAEEALAVDIPPMLRALRGDWFCSAFGENREPVDGQILPPHGETANRLWRPIASGRDESGSWLRLAVDMPLQRGACVATTMLLHGHSVIYQRHDLGGLTGPTSLGHHATLAFPDHEGAAHLSFSRPKLVQTSFEPVGRPEDQGYSCLAVNTRVEDLAAAPRLDGGVADLTRYPARRGYEDIVLIAADPTLEFAWSAATVAQEGYVWFALRDPRRLASTLLWFSNGGRYFAPWSGRHVNVLGIEDVTGYFHAGAAASIRPNPLSEQEVLTSLDPVGGRLTISYIQGVTRIPPDFDYVADIRADGKRCAITLVAGSGAEVSVDCDTGFLATGTFRHWPQAGIERG